MEYTCISAFIPRGEASGISGDNNADPKVCADIGSNTLQIAKSIKPALAPEICKRIIADRNSEDGKLFAGTYIHPDLVPSIAGWISPEFQIKANRVVNAFIAHQYKEQLADMQASNESKTIIIDMKNEIIEMKDEIINNQNELIETTQQNHIEALETINQQLKTIDAKENDIDMLEEVVQDKEVAIKKKDKIHQVWADSHGIVVMRTNNPTSKMPYYAIRRKQKTMSKVIQKFRVKFPCSIMAYQNSHVPNPINMYNRLKRSPIIKFKGNYCNCNAGEAALIEELKRVFTIVEQ
jgi:hypothetical protein